VTARSILGALSVALILVATIVAATVSARSADDQAEQDDRVRMTQLVGGMRAETSRVMAVAESAGALIAAGGAARKDEFAALGRRIGSEPGVGYLTWMPRVTAAQRAEFEREIGLGLWTATLFDPDGVPAPSRPVHYPVKWTAAPGVRSTVGFDPYAFPLMAGTLDQADATGRPAATHPMPLSFQESTPMTAVFVPVRSPSNGRFSSQTVGFIGASIIVEELESLAALEPGAVQVTDDGGVLVGAPIEGETLTAQLDVAGRSWNITMARQAVSTPAPWFILGGGALLALMVAALFAGGHRRERRALALVERRLRERVDAEGQLRSERDYSRAIVDALQDGLLVLDEDGTVVRANEHVTAIAGFPAETLVGARWPLPFWPIDDDGAARAFAELRTVERVEAEVRLRTRDGGGAWVLLTAAALHHADGGVAGHLVALKDITDRREAEQELAARASADPLTGLANHRSFHDTLEREVTAAAAGGLALAVAVLDLDHFKQINDTMGHQAGDDALREVARRLASCIRSGDTLARVGGEEFAWLLPGTSAEAAFSAVERARRAVGGLPVRGVGSVTLSAGISDMEQAASASELYRLADGALYWAKANGRNRTFVYTPEVVEATSAEEYATRLERLRAISTIQALARAVDAKDESTRRHSERVADIAAAIARQLGWSPDDADMLHGAGLVHDVGKIGVPDAILFKPGSLTIEEYEQVKLHAALGGQIVAGALTDRQARWVRGHHERWDGGGYPDGLAGSEIPEGARILALADAWDVMTVARHYSAPRDLRGAVEECTAMSGTQFWPEAVEALVRLAESGSVAIPTAPEARATADGEESRSGFSDPPGWTIVGSPRKGGDPA